VYLSTLLLTLRPPEVVTSTSWVPAACAGTVTVILVEEWTVKWVVVTVPKRTEVAPVKPVPVMVTRFPPAVGPLRGLTAVTVGLATWLFARVVEVSETEVEVSARLVEVSERLVEVSPGVVVDSFVTDVEVVSVELVVEEDALPAHPPIRRTRPRTETIARALFMCARHLLADDAGSSGQYPSSPGLKEP